MRAALLLLVALLAGCPEKTAGKASGDPGPCKKFGQNCQIAPGKLGSCVVLDNCTEGNCFACQSQH